MYSYTEIGNIKTRSFTIGGTPADYVNYVYQGQKVMSGSSDSAHDSQNKIFGADYDGLGNMIPKTIKNATGNTHIWNYVYNEKNWLIAVYKNAVGSLSGNTPVTEFTYDYDLE